MSITRSSSDPSALQAEITPLLEGISQIAANHSEDPLALLSLLRQLEHLHRSIQDGPFRSSLPSERSSLFRLLQDMELSGGWPYIPRLQLRTFLDLLQQDNLVQQDNLGPQGESIAEEAQAA